MKILRHFHQFQQAGIGIRMFLNQLSLYQRLFLIELEIVVKESLKKARLKCGNPAADMINAINGED